MESAHPYRDDGPLAELWSRWHVGGSSLLLMLLAVTLLFTCLRLDGADTSWITVGGVALFVLAAGASAGARPAPLVQWLVPPLLRISEYGLIVWLGLRSGTDALAVVYGLLAALAFHHYDIVYRLRHQNAPPPMWVRSIGGGWGLRILLLTFAALADVFVPVAATLAVWCAMFYVAESVHSWTKVAQTERRNLAEQ